MAGLAELVDQGAKLRSQLIGLVGRAGLLNKLANLLEQLTGLVGLAKLAKVAELVDQLANLLDELAGRTGRVNICGLIGLKGLEHQALLLSQRLTRLDLGHCNPCHRSDGRSGHRGGSPSPRSRPESLHRVVT